MRAAMTYSGRFSVNNLDRKQQIDLLCSCFRELVEDLVPDRANARDCFMLVDESINSSQAQAAGLLAHAAFLKRYYTGVSEPRPRV